MASRILKSMWTPVVYFCAGTAVTLNVEVFWVFSPLKLVNGY